MLDHTATIHQLQPPRAQDPLLAALDEAQHSYRFYRRPTRRLAVEIAYLLLSEGSYDPWTLVRLREASAELHRRLRTAKV